MPGLPPATPPIIFTVCFLMQAVGIGTYVAFGVFFNPLLEEFECRRVVISGVSSTAFMMMGLVGVLIGRLNDRYGPRLLLSVTSLFFGAGFVMMSQVERVWQLYLAYGVLVGIGLSSIDVLALTTIARWFTQRRGTITGLVKVGTGAGQFLIPILASGLIARVGWRHSSLILGLTAAAVLFLLAQLLVRDPGSVNRKLHGQAAATRITKERGTSGLSFETARRTVQLWTLGIVNMLAVMILISVMVHIVPHSRDVGLTAGQAASVLSTIGAASMIGRFLSGILIDGWGSKNVMLSCFTLLAAALILLHFAATLWMLLLFALINGIAHGGLFTAVSPITAEIFGLRSHGTILGVIVCFGTAGGAFGPILAGSLFDLTGSYTIIFWGFVFLSIVALSVLLPLKPVQESR